MRTFFAQNSSKQNSMIQKSSLRTRMRFYQYLVFVYLSLVVCFSYGTLLGAVPDHIYVTEGENPDLDFHVPVSFSVENGEAVSTGAGVAEESSLLLENAVSFGDSYLAAGTEYVMTCRFLGIFPLKEVEVSVTSAQSVYASGRVIGIYGKTSGVLALKTQEVTSADGSLVSPAGNRVLPGDYIRAVNQSTVYTKEELIAAVQENGEKRLTLTLERKGETITVAIDPVYSEENTYLIGVWVKDDMAGIGTMTFYTSSGSFGALGHGIGDGETGELLSISEGSIYKMRLLGIQKGQTGTPGELEGIIYYGNENYLGSVEENDEVGIYGTLDGECLTEYSRSDDCFEIGYKQQIKTGSAYILSDISGEVERYEIVIDSVNFQSADTNKGIHFHVTDSELIELTGGIVQGMSGSPIIQNGMLIGAVTHVLVNDPTSGYGIFVENMMEH
jgi:stage IV sporulation protein B